MTTVPVTGTGRPTTATMMVPAHGWVHRGTHHRHHHDLRLYVRHRHRRLPMEPTVPTPPRRDPHSRRPIRRPRNAPATWVKPLRKAPLNDPATPLRKVPLRPTPTAAAAPTAADRQIGIIIWPMPRVPRVYASLSGGIPRLSAPRIPRWR